MLSSGQPNFLHPEADTQNWYVAARASAVRRGRAVSYSLLHRRIVLYRDAGGAVHALDARCPHLGADLGQGAVAGDGVECSFHHWQFGPDGNCRFAPGCAAPPGRRVRAYPAEERWGLVWIFNGPHPLFPLPSVPDSGSYRIVVPPARRIGCHPHLVVGNGLDTCHMEALHGMEFSAAPQWSVHDPWQVSATVQGRPRPAWLRRITGSARRDIAASFTTTGGNLAWTTVSQPVRFHVLFTGQPDPRGGCRTQLVLFLPAGWGVGEFQALALISWLLHKDRRLLEGIEFWPGFAAGDEALRALADTVNRMPVW